MKKHRNRSNKGILFFLFLSLLTFNFQLSTAQPWHTDPQAIGSGREWPRTQFAVEERHMQPLADWEAVPGDEATTYKTTYKVPFAWVEREIFLRVPFAEGAYEVSVNGKPAGYTQAAHGGVEWNVTKLSREGNNTLEIKIFHHPVGRQIEQYAPETVAPRPPVGALILSQPRVRIRDIVVEAGYLNGSGQLTFGAVMATHLLNEKAVRIHYELFAPDSTRLFWGHRDEKFSMREHDTITFFHRIDTPRLWSADTPDLYTLVLRLQQEGRYTEQVQVRVGLSSIEYQGNSLIVNGVETPAVARNFVPSGDLEQDRIEIDALKAQGVNALELLPHPAGEAFYAMCDSIGIYLVDRADIDTRRAGNTRLRDQNPTNMPRWRAAYLDRVQAMYHRSKSHPSVVGFSIAGQAANGYNLYESYLKLKALEGRRPIIYRDAAGEWNSDM